MYKITIEAEKCDGGKIKLENEILNIDTLQAVIDVLAKEIDISVDLIGMKKKGSGG